MTKWGARYRSFVRLRFDRFSKGGGDWPPLKASTIRGRRKGKKGSKGKIAILRNLGILFAALQVRFVGAPGQVEKRIKAGVRVGYGGPATHSSGIATVAKIASFHQLGKGNLPVREIIVEPDRKTSDAMAKDLFLMFKAL